MMKIKKESYPPIIIGISFMLVVFITLSMVVFAVLSFSTAKKDFDYSQMNAEHTTAYYNACNLAEEEFYKLMQKMDNYSDGDIFEICIEMNEIQSLKVSAVIEPSSNNYTINSWNIISTKDWNGDNTLSVIGSKH